MKIFRVVVEHDGPTTSGQGRTSTEILRSDYRYAAESIKDVWAAISWLLDDPERNVVLVMEEAPAVIVLDAAKEGRE